MGCHFLLKKIFLTQGSNLGLLHYRQILLRTTREAPNLPIRKCKRPSRVTYSFWWWEKLETRHWVYSGRGEDEKEPVLSSDVAYARHIPHGTSKLQWVHLYSVQFISVAQSRPTLCDTVNCSMPGLPVHHQQPDFTQTHVHWVSDAIQPLLSPSPPAFNLSQHQGLFTWVSSSHQVAKVLEFQL